MWPVVLAIAAVVGALGLGNVLSGPAEEAGPRSGQEGISQTVRDVGVPTVDDRIRVEVLNGSGVAGVAGRATERLRQHGLDVVYFGNEASFGRDSSVVLDRTQREGALETVSESLEIHATRVDPDPSRLVDVTVLLGRDWEPVVTGLDALEDSARPDGGEGPLSGLRRLLDGGR